MARRELARVPLDHLANKITAARDAREHAAELIAFAEEIEREIREAMGNMEEATVYGVPVITYSRKAAYAWKQFQDAHPHVARRYMVTVEKQELDKKRLAEEQGDLLAEFQTREFRWVSRKPGS